ncbi:MAG TPA: PDZ domain-containing protein [Alphaproteobacteria bacterium]|nr:PDZ domain-containing protein [Alphaproteobacteria bacterium]
MAQAMRVLLAAFASCLAGAALADSAPASPAHKLDRTPHALAVRNVVLDVAVPPGATPARNKLGLSLSLGVDPDPTFGLDFADSIEPFLAAIGLTGESGALVFGVDRNGPAARAGVLPGDLIVSVAGNRVRDAVQLKGLLRSLGAKAVAAEIIRVGRGPGDLVAQLRATAARGNRDAMLALGDAALFNLDGRGQIGAAEDYYLRAYAMGDARAAWRLGTMYAAGRGVPVDLAVATRWYRLAADAGLPAGQFALGLTWWNSRYWTGLALAGDYAEAVRLFTLAAGRGYAPAYLYLGLAHHFGYGVERDYEAATAWYRKAAAAGDTEAMVREAEMVEAGQGTPADPAAALDLLKAAARLGNVEANRRLGEKYWRGEGVMQHPLNAIAYLEVAAAQGDARSMSLIAQILLSGYGVTRDETGAVQWYFKAYQAGDADAGYALALAYADGIGVPQDQGKVAGFMLDAIRRGSAAALAEMKGNAESWDIGVREDLQELLQAAGLYHGEIDGVFGPATLRALDAAAGG